MALLEVRNLKKYFPVQRSLLEILSSRERKYVKAVDGISFSIEKGETLALIGESGCGKTTTGRLILRLIEPTSGSILFDGKDIVKLRKKELRQLRRRMQMIFQDPYASLNPRMKIGNAIAHPLLIHNLATRKEAREIALKMLRRVGLTPEKEFYDRLPHQLSGGQRQRVVIARAMVLKPEFVVADEPVSMIDVSMRASILDLLQEFKKEYGLTMLFITHDIAIGRIIADKLAVMYLGKIVELGPVDKVINNPLHPYTLALIESVPSIRRRKRARRIKITGEVPNPINPPSGCRFHPRCPFATKKCSSEEPKLIEVEPQHYVACFNPLIKH
ncbi:ABC transporter ATP-binding protein [Staphylothermus hellenicus]|uniref:Oligopeptide/dipeptide ABC transporter, ATPase subunit n=1 Tax=Staphylothermus hellenicus (strain DSM 12710 / JCM 10830 / BK20S6-10-b1 / P8) TaxID=591019 RepID=D7D869_STAHD|nr:oligopeptide/dipeptide ABC transporter ATP-binding protein [Staphylothermus hellenicus]ADI31965.1 oligopeptide/dipeptide ABC transporter, ATPase subunit [Staphylothermus hellenicus DSM 12710]